MTKVKEDLSKRIELVEAKLKKQLIIAVVACLLGSGGVVGLIEWFASGGLRALQMDQTEQATVLAAQETRLKEQQTRIATIQAESEKMREISKATAKILQLEVQMFANADDQSILDRLTEQRRRWLDHLHKVGKSHTVDWEPLPWELFDD